MGTSLWDQVENVVIKMEKLPGFPLPTRSSHFKDCDMNSFIPERAAIPMPVRVTLQPCTDEGCLPSISEPMGKQWHTHASC